MNDISEDGEEIFVLYAIQIVKQIRSDRIQFLLRNIYYTRLCVRTRSHILWIIQHNTIYNHDQIKTLLCTIFYFYFLFYYEADIAEKGKYYL